MNPITISAQFAAYIWFMECRNGKRGAEQEATAFARDNWQAFRGHAHEGLGRLLIRVARLGQRKARRKLRQTAAQA